MAARMTARGIASSNVRRWLLGSTIPLALATSWMILSHDRRTSYAFVPLGQMAASAVELVASGELVGALAASLAKTATGLVLGVPAGVVVGASMGASRSLDRALGPLLHAFRQVPYLGLAPLIGLWFGVSDVAKVLLVFLAVFYPMVLSAYEGVRNVDSKLIDVARVLKLDASQVVTKLVLPSVLPHLYTGLSQAIAFAWIATIGSEMLLHAGGGVGTLMQMGEAAGRLDVVFVGVLSVALASFGLDSLFGLVGRHVMRWRDDAWSRG